MTRILRVGIKLLPCTEFLQREAHCVPVAPSHMVALETKNTTYSNQHHGLGLLVLFCIGNNTLPLCSKHIGCISGWKP